MPAPLKWILDRLREPSTWAGFMGLLLAFGLSEDIVGKILEFGPMAFAVIFGVLATILKDKPQV